MFNNDDEVQSTADVRKTIDKISDTEIKDIVKTDDTKNNDEKAELKMFLKSPENDLLKFKNIKNRMLPLTMKVTIELYNRYETDINYVKVLDCVMFYNNHRRKKVLEDTNQKLAKSILDFLNNNGIIESDEGYENKYYFTIFGKKYMYYCINGMI